MTEEVKITNEGNNEHKCICQNEGFRNFLTIALGTFVGVYCALCLFSAIHKPPMVIPQTGFGGFGGPVPAAVQCPCKHRPHFKCGHHKFHNEQMQNNQENHPAPFDSERGGNR